jgi:hypothetical protein
VLGRCPAGERLDAVSREVHDEVLGHAGCGIDGCLAQAIRRQRGVGYLDDQQRFARVLVLPALERARRDGEVGLGNVVATGAERALHPHDRSASDRPHEERVDPRDRVRMRRALRRHRHHHPFQELHAIVGADVAARDEGEVLLRVEPGRGGFGRLHEASVSPRSGPTQSLDPEQLPG